MISDIDKLLGRIYQGFFLRDILGFILPGSLSLLSILIVLHSKFPVPQSSLVSKLCQTLVQGDTIASCEIFVLNWGIIIFLGSAYLWAWILQSLYYVVLVNWLIPLNWIFPKIDLLSLSSKNFDELKTLVESLPRVTRGALQPEFIKARSMTTEQRKKLLEELPYTERASALMLLSANLGSGFFLLALIILIFTVVDLFLGKALLPLNFIVAVVLIVVGSCLYREHWQIWNFRNMQLTIYAAALKKPDSDADSNVSETFKMEWTRKDP